MKVTLFRIRHDQADKVLSIAFIFASLIAGFILQATPVELTAVAETESSTGNQSGCSFSSTVTSAHSSTIELGASASDFGSTKITTICSNSINHQVYARGYSNNVDGNTNLISNGNNLIPTGIETGNVSNWSMKISKDSTSYLPANLSITNSFDSYHVVPNVATMISSYSGGTDGSTGSSILTTYSARISNTQVAGNYVGQVKYTLVATETYAITIKTNTGIEKVILNNVECISSSGCLVSGLISGNSYSLTAILANGYSFNGWGTVTNGTIGNSSLASTTFTVGEGSDVLVPSASALVPIQNFDVSSCTSTPTAVYDTRDNHTYTIQQLEDGNCWMMENLDLGRTTLTTNLTSANTNLRTTVTASTFNSWKDNSSSDLYNEGYFHNYSGTDTTSSTPFGTQYNYFAASAGTVSGEFNGRDAMYDICPAGWRLPTGGSEGEYQALYESYPSYELMTGPIANGGAAITDPSEFPNSTYYFSSTRNGGYYVFGLVLDDYEESVSADFDTLYRSDTSFIRCVAKKDTHLLTVNYGSNVSEITVGGYVVANGSSVSLEEETSYIIGMKPASGYGFDGWTTSTGTIGSSELQYTTYEISSSNDTLSASADIVTETMQNLSSSSCTTTPSKVIDNRDGQVYTIQRLEDGNCWMMDNLNLGADDLNTNLTSANTNIPFTISASTFNNWRTTEQTHTDADGEMITVSGADPISGTAFGTLYNYYAASAGTFSEDEPIEEIEYDICPAGWRLPTSQTDYGSDVVVSGDMELVSSTYQERITSSILDNGAAFTASGLCDSSSSDCSFYWSSSYTGVEEPFVRDILSIQTGSSFVDSFPSASLNSIRCLLNGDLSITDFSNMQDFYGIADSGYTRADFVSLYKSIESDTTYSLTDTRDGKLYSIAKLNNGSIMMVDNLDLGRTPLVADLTSSNTNLPYNETVSASTFNSWKKNVGSGTYVDGEFISLDGTDPVSNTAYGTLYNFYAATAGYVNKGPGYNFWHYSICPAGWELSASPLYSYDYSNARIAVQDGGAALTLSGEFSVGAPTGLGESGYYWANMYEIRNWAAYNNISGANNKSITLFLRNLANGELGFNSFDNAHGASIRCEINLGFYSAL